MEMEKVYTQLQPDFNELAAGYPYLAKFLKTSQSNTPIIDFKNPRAVRELTYAILWIQFGLRLEIPLDTLCPPVPNRLNFILFIQDLVQNDDAMGIDIGTGASAIYPLLGCQLNKKWKFVGLDIDDRSLEYAQENVRRNQLHQRIRLHVNTESSSILPPALFEPGFLHAEKGSKKGKSKATIQYDFVMCNPPFYESERDIQQSAMGKGGIPSAVCMGTQNEMITAGGEVQFIEKIVEESVGLQTNVKWFTSLVGRKSNVAKITEMVSNVGAKECKISQLKQGKTSRWVVAWRFSEM